MAQAGYAKKISINDSRRNELSLNFQVGKTITTKKGILIQVVGLWGDRCIVANDNNIYNVEADLGYKFSKS